MKDGLSNRLKEPVKEGRELRKGRSPFTAKSVWIASGLFIGSGSAMFSGQAEGGGMASWLQSQSPIVLTAAGSYLAGFFVGWGARRTIKLTSVIVGVLVALIGLTASLGWDSSVLQSWLNSGGTWLSENIESAEHYLLSLLPSATAAGAGGVLGFRRGR